MDYIGFATLNRVAQVCLPGVPYRWLEHATLRSRPQKEEATRLRYNISRKQQPHANTFIVLRYGTTSCMKVAEAVLISTLTPKANGCKRHGQHMCVPMQQGEPGSLSQYSHRSQGQNASLAGSRPEKSGFPPRERRCQSSFPVRGGGMPVLTECTPSPFGTVGQFKAPWTSCNCTTGTC